MKRRRSFSLLMGLVAAISGVLVFALPAAASGGPIRNAEYRELCLQPVDGSTEQGAAIVTALCDRSTAQAWAVDLVGDRVLHFRNELSGLCLDARGDAANRTPVQQWTCNSISNENWEINEVFGPDAPFTFVSRVSGTRSHCLDIPNGRDAPGVAMQIYRCNGTPTQLWGP